MALHLMQIKRCGVWHNVKKMYNDLILNIYVPLDIMLKKNQHVIGNLLAFGIFFYFL